MDLTEFIGKTISGIKSYPTSPGLIITFDDGTVLTIQCGAFGGLKVEIE